MPPKYIKIKIPLPTPLVDGKPMRPIMSIHRPPNFRKFVTAESPKVENAIEKMVM